MGRDVAMTPKQERFVAEYLTDLNATQAAIRAGYSPRTAKQIGQENLTKPDVAAAIQSAQAARAARTGITQDWVVQRLRENVERAMQRQAVLGPRGVPTGEYTYSGAVANGALNLLGKHLGMFSDKLEVAGRADSPVVIRFVREDLKRTAS